ncbi:hypothetical protein [Neorhodopirellula pilleata]|uniref:MucB/RseB N-terminal domain-containing protein n=1 Tax=Neorhodopirellula pilleata TaxID=2714738 RepID=A0A5C6AC13_9BACT|nr:hypothetical protein [Neorhodopirellula pilleata]TWT97129.1 hypothetical protein Pla100_22780 [Neorhodopirellula pilleata]
MNENEELKRGQLRDCWIESLLASAVTPQDHADHVARAMKRINEPEATHVADVTRTSRRSVRWGAIAIAASVLIALSFVLDVDGTSAKAMAAVQRSLHVAAEQMTRKYLLQVQYRSPTGSEPQIDNELYVQGHDRFVLRHPGLLSSSSFWLGKNETDEWVVPPIGPVRIGSDMVLSRWLASHEQLDTPYLHVTTLLTRMSQGYRLDDLSDKEVTLPDGTVVACQHIRAELDVTDEPNAPDTIELWVSRETGMAIRIVVRWNLADGEAGRKSIALTFQTDEPALSDEWFTPEAHYQGRRVIMRIDSLGQPTFERP